MALEELMPGVLRYVQISSATAKKAIDQLATHQQHTKAATDQIPATVEALVANGTISGHQKEAVAKMLGNHAQTLQLLQNAAVKIAEYDSKLNKTASAGSLGKGVDGDPTKEASDNEDGDKPTPYVGARSSEKRGSDRAMLRGLGLSTD